MITPAFLVGSHVYGAPRPDSDVDLVVRLAPETAAFLYAIAGQSPDGPLRFGKLNIICALDDAQYEAWVHGLADIIVQRAATCKPIDCATARDMFRVYDAIHGTPSCTVPFTPDGDPVSF